MDHIAIDLGSKRSQVCIRTTDSKVQLETKCRTRDLGQWLETQPKARVVMEACSEAFEVARAARAAGHEAVIVPPTLVRALGVGARRVKTDERDAQALSLVSCRMDLPGIHIPSEEAQRWRELLTSRQSLLKARTELVNSVRGWLRSQLKSLALRGTETFPKRVRELLQQVPVHIEWQLKSVETLTEQIREATRMVRKLAKADAVCRLLMTAPGVGPVTSLRFRATIDDVKRFSSGHSVQSYLGLTPGEHSSGETKRRTGISRAGPSQVRSALVEAAWIAMRYRPTDPMMQWASGVMARRGKQIAAVALARKLAGLLYAMWRDNEPYNPTQEKQELAPSSSSSPS
jgi:transposase